LEAKITALKAAIAANNVVEMQTEMTELSNLLQRVGQAVYSQAGGGPEEAPGESATGEPGSGDDEGGTVEGQFREV
jgi:hypothetical protein